MTYLDAAYTILKAAGQPLHFEEITQRALAQKLIAPQGLTPEATMGSRLYTDTKQEGSHFVRAGKGAFGLAQWQPKGIEPERFEVLIRELLIRMGFDESTVKVTPFSGDGGIDVTGIYRAAGLTEMSAAVQVKRWKGNVGAPVVTQLRGSLQVHQQGIIITTSDFSQSARAEAAAPNKTRIGLISGAELIALLVKHQVGVVKRTLEVAALDDEYWGELIGQAGPIPVPAALGAGATAANTVSPAAATPKPRKPAGFVLFGQHHAADTWRGVLVGACAVLAQRHGAAFGLVAATVKGRTRHYIVASPAGLITPAPIPGTDLWVEANQSAKSVVQVIGKLLVALGHAPEEFVINPAG